MRKADKLAKLMFDTGGEEILSCFIQYAFLQEYGCYEIDTMQLLGASSTALPVARKITYFLWYLVLCM